jgi:putative ABC transport system permease protein
MRREGLDREPIATAFLPGYLRAMDMTIRVRGDAGGLAAAVRREIRAIDPGLPVTQITGAADRLEERLSGRRFETHVLVLFAAIGLALSAAGLYASLAYQVTLRTRELGIRTALGADRQSIVRMVLADGFRRAAAGVAIGVGCAVGAARLLQSLLYETPALNAAGFLWPVSSVLAVAAIAASIPAFRAARVSPLAALRED